MRVWTMQPKTVFDDLFFNGEHQFVCDPEKSEMYEDYKKQYNWYVNQMKKRIPPPEGVTLPIWGWYNTDAKQKKPDHLAKMAPSSRSGKRLVLFELEIPDSEVLLSDFDNWNNILCDDIISDTEDEDIRLRKELETLPEEEKREMKEKNWERVFRTDYRKDGWNTRGVWVQGTFWVLKEEYIRKIYL